MIHTHLIRKWSVRYHTWKCFAVAAFLAIASLSCKKQQLYEGNPAVLQVFNALEDGTWLYANLTGTHPIRYANALLLANQRYGKMNINDVVQPLAFYTTTDTLPKDTPVWNTDLKLERGKMYSLFLFGEKTHAEHRLIENNYPRYRTDDSVTNVRFANMSNGQPVSINLKGNPAGSLVSSLPYKEVTAFIALKADKSVASYEFEFRDADTGALLGSSLASDVNNYLFGNIYLNRSWMLVLAGKPGGSTLNIITVYN
jgi:hypothetical protein